MTAPIITFLSDFGLEDWFVGVVHGVVHEICPAAHVVDLSHAIGPGDIVRAAFMIDASAPDFAPGTIHLAVVDPGVGTGRRALAVRAHGQFFVGPDNGLLEWAISDSSAEIRSLTEDRWFRSPMSRTFHGRDVFAPVAAHLARGIAIEELGPIVTDPVRLARAPIRFAEGRLEGSVMFVDRFGNALTDIGAEMLAQSFPGAPENRLRVEIGARVVSGVSRSYGDAPIGTAVAIIGSSGRLEIAEVGGHAASRFGLGIGDRVKVHRE